jgi:hypothetical protein
VLITKEVKDNYNIFLPQSHYNNEELKAKIDSSIDKLFLDAEKPIHYNDCSHLEKEIIEETLTWMKKCKFKTLNSKKHNLNKLVEDLKKECKTVQKVVSRSGRPLLGIDTETTSLGVKFKLEGGSLLKGVDLVDVVIATSHKKGYLIPFRHNETDKVINYTEEDMRGFLQRLVDEFHLVYFNAEYDMKILTQFGVEVDPDNYTDVVLVGNALGLDTVQDLHNRHNLKYYSEYFLDRKMLTIEELMGSKFIAMTRLPATTASVYAVADAVNTLNLFNHLVEGYDSFETQAHILALDHQTLYHHISMFNHGLPLNNVDKVLYKNLLTIIHRIGIVEEKYYEIEGSLDFKISTPEKVNFYIAKIVIEALGFKLDFFLFSEDNKKGEIIDNYLTRIAQDFGVILKVDENKSRGKFIKGETRKVGTEGVEVLVLSKKAVLENEYWLAKLKKRDRKKIEDICNIVGIYRVLQLELSRLGKMYRYCVADDRGYGVASVDLRFNGTDTRRYSNSSGSGDHRFIVRAKDVQLYLGNGLAGVNAQGLPSTVYTSLQTGEGQRDPLLVDIKDKSIIRWLKRVHKKNFNRLQELLLTKFNQKK